MTGPFTGGSKDEVRDHDAASAARQGDDGDEVVAYDDRVGGLEIGAAAGLGDADVGGGHGRGRR